MPAARPLAIPVAQPIVEPATYPDVWQPFFIYDNRSLTIYDSAILHDSTTSKGLVTPRDQVLLADKDETNATNNSLAFSIQSVASISNMALRLSIKK